MAQDRSSPTTSAQCTTLIVALSSKLTHGILAASVVQESTAALLWWALYGSEALASFFGSASMICVTTGGACSYT
eukprot:49810-Amphidinium_carterae.1